MRCYPLSVNNKRKASQAAENTVEGIFTLLKSNLTAINQARLKCFAMLVQGIIEARTVNSTWLSQCSAAPESVKSASFLRRIQRFFAGAILPSKSIGAMLLSWLPKPEKGWILAMDRTNWRFGRIDINILAVIVSHGGVGIPICWKMLPKATKRGNSRKYHRIKMMEEILTMLDPSDIRALTMDREFIGKGWLGFLELHEIPYIVRLKKNALVSGISVEDLSCYNRWRKHLHERREVFGQQVYFASKRIKGGRDPHVSVISNVFSGTEAVEIYRTRWSIETFFSHLKKRGFNLEDTHLTRKERIDKLFGVLAVAFALCYLWGQLQETKTGAKYKNHGYRAKSVFRQGFECLHRMFKAPSKFQGLLVEFFEYIFAPSISLKIVG